MVKRFIATSSAARRNRAIGSTKVATGADRADLPGNLTEAPDGFYAAGASIAESLIAPTLTEISQLAMSQVVELAGEGSCMSMVVRCIIHGEQDHWEGICLDLDIAVYGASFKEVEDTLTRSVQTYVEDAMKEAPAQRDRLLSRHVPWLVRLRLSVALALHMLTSGKNERNGRMQSGFDLACPA